MANTCIGVWKDSTKCSGYALPGRQYCLIHEYQDESQPSCKETPVWMVIFPEHVSLYDVRKLPKKILDDGPEAFKQEKTYKALFLLNQFDEEDNEFQERHDKLVALVEEVKNSRDEERIKQISSEIADVRAEQQKANQKNRDAKDKHVKAIDAAFVADDFGDGEIFPPGCQILRIFRCDDY